MLISRSLSNESENDVEPITQSEYYTQCQAIANELVAEHEGNEESIQDALHETITDHQWITYTYYTLQVLAHSHNENAFFDDFGEPLNTSDFSSTMTKLAFFAMMADVQEYLSTALESYKSQ